MQSSSRSKRNIVFGVPSILVGGIERHLVQQLHFFDREKYELHLIILFSYPDRPTLVEHIPPYVHYYQCSMRGMGDIRTWIKIYRILRRIKPDIVVSSMFSANALFRVLKPFVGYRCLPREHNTYTDKQLFHRIVDHVLSYLSAKIIAVSEVVADFASAQAWIPRSRFVVINNGVDIEAINAFRASIKNIDELKKKLGLSQEKKYIINVARLKKQKNQELLIRAFALFSKDMPDIELLIIGEGNERPVLERLIRDLGVTESVHLMGYRSDIFSFYAVSDFFVLTSHIEGFPNVCIEAMAFGLPVISTRVAGIPEVIQEGKNGYIVEPQIDDIVRAMKRYGSLSDNQRDLLSHTVCQTVAKRDISHVTKAYEAVFDDVLTL